MGVGVRVTLQESCVIFHIINVAFLKTNSGRYGMKGLKNMILSSFNLLSGGNGGQRVLGIQSGSTRTMDLKENRLSIPGGRQQVVFGTDPPGQRRMLENLGFAQLYQTLHNDWAVCLSLGYIFSGVPETGMRDNIQNTFILVLYMVPGIINKAKHFLRKAFYQLSLGEPKGLLYTLEEAATLVEDVAGLFLVQRLFVNRGQAAKLWVCPTPVPGREDWPR